MEVLALVEARDHVCFRYRIGAFEQALNRAGCSLAVAAVPRRWPARLTQFTSVGRFDAVILQRRLLPRWLLRRLRRKSRGLIYDFDDALMYHDSYDRRGIDCPRCERRFAATVQAADIVIAGNDYLAENAVRFGARADRVRVVPTCVAIDRYAPARHDPNRVGLELVWIGSSSTLQGLEQRRDLWVRLAREVPGLRLRMICDRFPSLDPMPVVRVAWSEATEASEIAAGDAGINWIPDDPWSRGKCGLKILQYQAAGLPSIANPVGAHATMIEPGATGFLATTPEEWIDAVRMLANDPSLTHRMGATARAYVEKHYSVAVWGPRFAEIITGGSAETAASPTS